MIKGNQKGTKKWWDSLEGKKIKFKENGNFGNCIELEPPLVIKVKAYPSNFQIFKPACLVIKDKNDKDRQIHIRSIDFDIHTIKKYKMKFNAQTCNKI